MRSRISVDEAQALILEQVATLPPETLACADALGRVLAEPLISRMTLPPADSSAMDGYAVRAEDLAGALPDDPALLPVVFEVPAGGQAPRPLVAGEAARIFTGAPLPAGADTVVPQEDTEQRSGRVAFKIPPKLGEHVRPAGEDVREGEQVLAAGTPLASPQLGMLAALGRSLVRVVQRPRVALLSGGDELFEPDDLPRHGGIIASNAYALAAECRSLGIETSNLGIAGDTPEDLESYVRAGLGTDVLISTAGVSVGDHDHVRPVLEKLGCEMIFWGVRMKPGFPVAFGRFPGGPLVFGLPGNPVSSLVSFLHFVRPALRKLCGHRSLYLPTVRARLTGSLDKNAGRRHFVRVQLAREADGFAATSTGNQSSGVLRSMALADGLLDFPEEATHLDAGDEVTVHLLHTDLL